MPHKRAKGPAREREQAGRAIDLAPKISIECEPIPKSVSRVLDAGRIKREYRKKRQLDGVINSDEDNAQRKRRRFDGSDVKDKGERTELKIKHGETISEFNRRVESNMVPLIKTALRQSSAQARKVRREEVAQEMLKRGKHGDMVKKGSHPRQMTAADEGNARHAVKEFEVLSTSAPRRLNDIAQEPPVMNKLPRGVARSHIARSGVLSMAQRATMEQERERAVKHYRELKAKRLRESGVQPDGVATPK